MSRSPVPLIQSRQGNVGVDERYLTLHLALCEVIYYTYTSAKLGP